MIMTSMNIFVGDPFIIHIFLLLLRTNNHKHSLAKFNELSLCYATFGLEPLSDTCIQLIVANLFPQHYYSEVFCI